MLKHFLNLTKIKFIFFRILICFTCYQKYYPRSYSNKIIQISNHQKPHTLRPN